MDAMSVVLTLGIVLGFVLLMYGAFFQKGKGSVPENGGIETNETLGQILQSVDEADSALSNINSVSSLIIEEIDIKYKELLFLYEMLEEKKKDILEHTGKLHAEDSTGVEIENEDGLVPDISEDDAYESNLELMEIGRKMDEIRRFPRLKNKDAILGLRENGYDITEIAKELGIGKGEVRLIIGLNKVGAANE